MSNVITSVECSEQFLRYLLYSTVHVLLLDSDYYVFLFLAVFHDRHEGLTIVGSLFHHIVMQVRRRLRFDIVRQKALQRRLTRTSHRQRRLRPMHRPSLCLFLITIMRQQRTLKIIAFPHRFYFLLSTQRSRISYRFCRVKRNYFVVLVPRHMILYGLFPYVVVSLGVVHYGDGSAVRHPLHSLTLQQIHLIVQFKGT